MSAVFEGARGGERATIKVMLAGDDASQNEAQRSEREAKEAVVHRDLEAFARALRA